MQIQKVILYWLVVLVCSTQAQFKWYLSPETGINRNENGRNSGLSTIEGLISYSTTAFKGQWSAKGQFRSEFYGISDPDHIQRYKFQTAFDRYIADAKVQVALNLQRHVFNQLNTNIIDILIVHLSGDYPLTGSSSLQGTLSAGKSKIFEESDAWGDVIMAELQHITAANPYLSFGGGVHTEKYRLRQKSIQGTTLFNIMKVGPVLSFDYLKTYIIQLQYRYLFYADIEGHEQYLRILSGMIILQRWSLFLLMDYYFQSVKSPFPVRLNTENRFFVKCGYTLSQHVEVYLKTGYYRDEFENTNKTFTRWNFLMGIEIRS